jgi:hypothetical protein
VVSGRCNLRSGEDVICRVVIGEVDVVSGRKSSKFKF